MQRAAWSSSVIRMQTTSNGINEPMVIARGLLLVAVAVVLACWCAGVAAATARLVASGAPVRPDEVLAALAAGASALCLLWLAVVVGLGLGALVPGRVGDAARAVGAALTPRLLRARSDSSSASGSRPAWRPVPRWPRRPRGGLPSWPRPALSPTPGSGRCRIRGGRPRRHLRRMPVPPSRDRRMPVTQSRDRPQRARDRRMPRARSGGRRPIRGMRPAPIRRVRPVRRPRPRFPTPAGCPGPRRSGPSPTSAC